METIVATIYADKISQLLALGFNETEISSHEPSNLLGPEYTTYYSVDRWFRWHEYENGPERMAAVYKFLDAAYTNNGKKRAGLDTDWHHVNEYSPIYY